MGQFAFGADGAAVGEHDVLGNGEAEAGASGFAGAGFIYAIETFEEARKVLGGNACAEIADEEFDRMGNGARAEHDAPACGAVLHSIVDQIGKDLVNGFAIGENVGRRSCSGKAEFRDLRIF